MYQYQTYASPSYALRKTGVVILLAGLLLLSAMALAAGGGLPSAKGSVVNTPSYGFVFTEQSVQDWGLASILDDRRMAESWWIIDKADAGAGASAELYQLGEADRLLEVGSLGLALAPSTDDLVRSVREASFSFTSDVDVFLTEPEKEGVRVLGGEMVGSGWGLPAVTNVAQQGNYTRILQSNTTSCDC